MHLCKLQRPLLLLFTLFFLFQCHPSYCQLDRYYDAFGKENTEASVKQIEKADFIIKGTAIGGYPFYGPDQKKIYTKNFIVVNTAYKEKFNLPDTVYILWDIGHIGWDNQIPEDHGGIRITPKNEYIFLLKDSEKTIDDGKHKSAKLVRMLSLYEASKTILSIADKYNRQEMEYPIMGLSGLSFNGEAEMEQFFRVVTPEYKKRVVVKKRITIPKPG